MIFKFLGSFVKILMVNGGSIMQNGYNNGYLFDDEVYSLFICRKRLMFVNFVKKFVKIKNVVDEKIVYIDILYNKFLEVSLFFLIGVFFNWYFLYFIYIQYNFFVQC